MIFDHHILVGFSKSFGLFYLIGLSLAALTYALWPSNRERFDRAANAILEDSEDTPCL
ncbi:cbb3-type cytochrome c oxidase subunit 3 [Sphingomonas flavalba]|uniref:cbb3-type cytochrome c oxidase subunit 3 n=1 Tax=Sphingomonas flavalba TaxID=2559804 RepID=UPI0039E02388